VTTEAPVCVIIVNYNGGSLLRRCIETLGAQTLPPREIVIVDNGSSDGSIAGLENLPVMSSGRVRVISPGVNLGFAAANNLGASLAGTPWVATLNPDAFPEPEWLAELMAATIRHPDAAMFGSTQLDAADVRRLDGAGDVFHASGLVWRGHHGAPADSLPPEGEVFAPCAAAALYRRDVFQEVGGFDEDFFCYCEDVDLGFRLRLMGRKCIQVARARVHHVGSAITGRRSSFATYHSTRNRVWMFVKNMPGVLILPLLPLHIALNALLLMRGVFLGESGAMLLGLRDALLGMRRVLARRRAIQARRVVSVAGLASRIDWSVSGVLGRRSKIRPAATPPAPLTQAHPSPMG
jgi:N-acetylglucosaminyl-diphospho-decaprenol L-rhamnosyltransferase